MFAAWLKLGAVRLVVPWRVVCTGRALVHFDGLNAFKSCPSRSVFTILPMLTSCVSCCFFRCTCKCQNRYWPQRQPGNPAWYMNNCEGVPAKNISYMVRILCQLYPVHQYPTIQHQAPKYKHMHVHNHTRANTLFVQAHTCEHTLNTSTHVGVVELCDKMCPTSNLQVSYLDKKARGELVAFGPLAL